MPTIDETIKILEELEHISYTPQKFYTVKALRLGIEALKSCQRDRRGLEDYDIKRLPGEE